MRFRKRVQREDWSQTRVACDRCGQDVRGRDDSEVEIQAKHGDFYPEGDSREVQEIDCCFACWKDAALPALIAAGFKVQTRDAEDFYANYQEDK